MSVEISVLVVNLNNLLYTRQCIEDLLNQDVEFNLRLVDQNSTEEGTNDFFNNFFLQYVNGEFTGKINLLEIIHTGYNRPLNYLWNEFVDTSSTDFLCLLNNDVRLPPNFLSTSISVLEKEPLVGFVNHVTNNIIYSRWSDLLEYKIMEQPYRQGWDITFRKSFYSQIPKDLTFFYGDDYIYSKLYSSNYKGAYIFNSPIIHFERSTTVEKGGSRDCTTDGKVFHLLELEQKNMNNTDNEFLKDCLNFVNENFSKKNKIISSIIEPVFTRSLTNKDDFTSKDFLFSRILYIYTMKLEYNNKEGYNFIKKIYADIYEELRSFSFNKEYKKLKLTFCIQNNKQFHSSLLENKNLNNKNIEIEISDKNILIGGRLECCDIKISEYSDINSCSRIHFLLLYYNDKNGIPTIAIIDPGSTKGIHINTNKYPIQKQVIYFDVSYDNNISIIAGEINIDISTKILN